MTSTSSRSPTSAPTASTRCSSSPTRFVEVSARAIPKVPALRGKTVVSLFFEDSTRTRLSFETAAKRLVGRHHDLHRRLVVASRRASRCATRSQTIEAMGVDAIVVRHALGRRAVRRSPAGPTPSVINAGDGWHEHPTQALLDCYTIRQRLGSLDGPAHRHRRRHQAQPGGPLRRAGLHRARRRRDAGRAADAAAADPRRAGRSTVSHDLDDGAAPRSTSSTCCACSASA